MNIIKNKKGAISDSDKILFWVIFVIPALSLIVSLIFIAMPRLIEAQTTLSPTLQQHIYMSKTIGSPLCFAYEDPQTNRVYNGYIDMKKFSSRRLDDCLQLTSRKDLGFFVSIYKDGTFYKEAKTQNVLRRVDASSIELDRPIILIENGQKINAILRFNFY